LPERGAPTAVLHLLDCLNPGGTEMQLLGQLRHVDRRRWRPLVGVFHEGGTLLPELRELAVPVKAFPLRYSLLHPNTALQVARIVVHCRREGVRLIHAHDFYANLVGLAAARLARVPIIASRRDLAHWLSPAQRRVLGIACRAADRVLANSRSVAALDADGLALPAARLRVVPNGIDLEHFDAEAALEPSPPVESLLREDERSRTVAVVSNMNLPDKGHADLLVAAAELATRGRRLVLLLVGDGAQRARLEAMAHSLDIKESVRFLGRRSDVPRILRRVSAACLPSWAEGFPNAVMEAMAAERPVVATAVGGCRELLEHGANGLLVPPRAPERLAEALARIFDDPEEAAAMGRRARRSVARRYALAGAAAAVESLYLELCAEAA
jgi:glycosyltransferase involved in cell wall biosynthesis